MDCGEAWENVRAKRPWYVWFLPLIGFFIIKKARTCDNCKGKLILATSPRGRRMFRTL
jgi:hypothetical protein